MMKNIMITGATGGLGGAVIDFLSGKEDQNLFALARNPESEASQKVSALGVEVRTGDYNDKESLVEAFKNIDVLYFISGSDITSRMPQHMNVVDASIKAGIKHVVYTSAGRKNETEEAPLFPVMNAHIKTENAIMASGLNYTILKHNLYAEVIPMFLGSKEQLLGSRTVYLPTENGHTAFATRMDMAEAGALILGSIDEHVNKIYSFNGQSAIGFNSVAKDLTDILEQPISYVSPSVEDYKKTMLSAGLPEGIIDMVIGFSLGIAQGEFEEENNDLEKILGRKPIPVSSFLKEVYG